MKSCVYCKEEIHQEAVVCPKCRRDQSLIAGWFRNPFSIIAILFLVAYVCIYLDTRRAADSIFSQFASKNESYLNDFNKGLYKDFYKQMDKQLD